MKITYTDNQSLWKLEAYYEEKGYHKVSECYWYQVYSNGSDEVTFERVDEVIPSGQPAERAEPAEEPAKVSDTCEEPAERTALDAYVAYKMDILHDFKVRVRKADRDRLRQCKNEIQADQITKQLILNKLNK